MARTDGSLTSEYKITILEDTEKTDFMFSEFPPDRDKNPKHWDEKMKFWKAEIENMCRYYGDFSISCAKLSSVLKDCNQRSPECLNRVVSELYQSNELQMGNNYTDLIDDTWGQWTYNIAKRSSLWVWNKAVHGRYNDETVFVLMSLLQENATKLLEQHYTRVKYENTDNIVPWNVIKNLYKIDGKPVLEENLVCIIGYLKSEGKCKIALTETKEKLVKFARNGEDKTDSITETDVGITKLKKGIAKLHMECKEVEKEVEELGGKAKALLQRKERLKAKRLIVLKSKMNKKLHTKQNALFGMKEQLRMVQEVECTKKIADVFKGSASVISQTYEQQGLTVEQADKVFDEVLEMKDMVSQIDEALSTGLQQAREEDYDMDELERELEDLKESQDMKCSKDLPASHFSHHSKVLDEIKEPDGLKLGNTMCPEVDKERMLVDQLPDVPTEILGIPPSGKARIKKGGPITF